MPSLISACSSSGMVRLLRSAMVPTDWSRVSSSMVMPCLVASSNCSLWTMIRSSACGRSSSAGMSGALLAASKSRIFCSSVSSSLSNTTSSSTRATTLSRSWLSRKAACALVRRNRRASRAPVVILRLVTINASVEVVINVVAQFTEAV